MGNPKYSDEERLAMFMKTAHMIIEKDYWATKIRPLGEIDKYNEYEMRIIFETGVVQGRKTSMDKADLDLVLPIMRRFLTESESLNTGKIINSIDAEGITGPPGWLNEVKSSWQQMTDDRFHFYAHDGVTVGMRPTEKGRLVRWDEGGPSVSEMQSQSISMMDVWDAYLNNEHLHDEEIGARPKRESIRKIMGSVPLVLAENLRAVVTSAAVYNFIALHHILQDDSRFKCTPPCEEVKALRKIFRSHLDNHGR